jgi:hypothetical protein
MVKPTSKLSVNRIRSGIVITTPASHCPECDVVPIVALTTLLGRIVAAVRPWCLSARQSDRGAILIISGLALEAGQILWD